MKGLLVLLVAVAVTSSEKYEHPLSDEFIKKINDLHPTWTAGRNFAPDTSMDYINGLMGALPEPEELKKSIPIKSYNVRKSDIPAEFDARKEWSNCTSINEIKDQGGCGACWAFGAVEAMTDRVCIASKGKYTFPFSAENVLACCPNCGFGCGGGYPIQAWIYWLKEGIVSGGPYGSNEGCQPYSIRPCQHHTEGPRPPCASEGGKTPTCKKECVSNFEESYEGDIRHGETAYYLANDALSIQQEILIHGPVEATFTVYEDFLNYKNGVYKHVTGSAKGGHAVKIIGWGTENEVPYWLVANSWNTDWGDKGFFKIFRGKNHCGIEGGISAGRPNINDFIQ